MGNNPSPFYVTNDIDLAAAGPGVSWRSSDPATLDVDGTVRRVRCDGDLPRTVDLTGSFPDGTERAFRFRVMPEKPRLPALFLYVADPVWKHRRTDFASARIPAGGGSPEILTGTASTGGGIRHRGNTSYVRGSRRSLSLEFDSAVSWTGAPGPVSHLLLLSGYADGTLLRNALSFDAFAAMRPDAPRGSIPVSWTEVFVNGEYTGVWETAPRLKDVVSGWAAPLYKVRTPEGLWTRVSAGMLDRSDVVVALPGGIGTLDEVFSVAAEGTLAYHAKRVIVYSMKGFWDGLEALLEHLQQQGLIRGDYRERIVFVHTLGEIKREIF